MRGVLGAETMDYDDVPGNAWYYDAVEFVTLKELFEGITDNTFGPDVAISRAMFITVLSRIEFGSDEDVPEGTSPFTDPDAGLV